MARAALQQLIALPPSERVLCVAEDPSVLDHIDAVLTELVATERALERSRILLTPGREGGFDGTSEEWRLARAQWHHDLGRTEIALRELADINALRRAHDLMPLNLVTEKGGS